MAKPTIGNRSAYILFQPITTRWTDNDVYGHVNNITYYSYFDTAVNNYLIEKGGLDIQNANIIGYIVNSSCNYYSGLSYPDKIEVGMRVNKLGNSSVQYGLGIFLEGESLASAEGNFTHVFVNRKTNSSESIPDKIRSALTALIV